jgi:hypothetical protein
VCPATRRAAKKMIQSPISTARCRTSFSTRSSIPTPRQIGVTSGPPFVTPGPPPERLEILGHDICMDIALAKAAGCGDLFVPPDAVGAVLRSAKT